MAWWMSWCLAGDLMIGVGCGFVVVVRLWYWNVSYADGYTCVMLCGKTMNAVGACCAAF